MATSPSNGLNLGGCRTRPGAGESDSHLIVEQNAMTSLHLAGEAAPPRAPLSLIGVAGAAHLIELLSE